jgi:hypothetical protein
MVYATFIHKGSMTEHEVTTRQSSCELTLTHEIDVALPKFDGQNSERVNQDIFSYDTIELQHRIE